LYFGYWEGGVWVVCRLCGGGGGGGAYTGEQKAMCY